MSQQSHCIVWQLITNYVEGYRHKGWIQAMIPGSSIFSCSALTLIMIYLAGSGQGKRDSPCHLFDCVILFVRPSKTLERSVKVMDGAKVFAGPCDCSYLDQESQCFDSCPAPVVLDMSRFCHSKLWTLKMQWPQLTMPLYLILQHAIWVHGFQTHIFTDCAACSQWSRSRAHTKL